ncbi:uncharacterized protein K02A2.6-like [Astatotilapia calliptera]|uniref:uncharacterized protein K02A2.6-like n=1 Tax=Astatotilapia calliptera TaxID=8154 RepID=UPI000E40809D|nr:uncharacterized protein K02A2.6-like [Astatotilapia calliptera]
MATTLGSVAPFDSELQSWEEYCEILDYFFVANDIKEEEKKRAVLLSCVGAQTYALIRNLLSPVKPGDRSYAELVGLLNNHFHPKPSEIVQRWKFNTRNRRPEESVGDYVAELRKLAQDCNFGDSLTVMLRDRLVCGISDDRIQGRLLAEDSLTFEKALKFAQAMEAANRDIVDLKSMTEQSRFTKGLGAVNKMEDGGSTSQQVVRKCYRCGGLNHVAKDCRFVSEKCHNCGKVGHIKRVCRMKMEQKGGRGRQGKQAHFLEEENVESEEEGAEMHHIKASVTMYNVHEEISIPREEPIRQKLKVNGQNVTFEVDTGCGYTIMSKESFKKLFEGSKAPKVSKCGIKLRTYGGHKVPVWGAAQVQVEFRDSKKTLDVVVVEGAGTSLMGRGWIKALQLDWQPVHKIEGGENALQRILARHETVFKDELGTLKGFAAKIHVAKDAKPCFYKPRSVPFAMKKKVEQELERLLEEKIIQPVKFSEWAAPIVPILKPDSSARICGDYKLTVNKVSPVEQYPIPRMEDMIAGLAGGEKYTKLDMSHAYQQVVLDEESRKYVTVNTHKGLFTYTRLPFGVSSSPAIFQRTMESVLQGLTNVAVYLDDIILTGKNDKEHLQTLEGVLQRLEEAGLRLKRSKCQFMEKEVTFLGHRVDKTGLHPVPAKVKAVQEAPPPKSVTELKAYLGLLNFYNKFLPNLSTLLAPLHKLLRKGEPWCWGPAQEKVFGKSKELLQSSSVLVHYDEQKDLILSCDASPYGVGAVLAHRMPDGQEKPIGFASRTLNAAEKNYSQLDKEGLAVIFGVQYFHKYLYGRKFMIITDHKPLISLFHELKAVPQMASQRIMRWAVLLRAYEYVIKYREGKNNSNADGLSRLPLPENLPKEVAAEDQVLMVDQDQEGVMTSEQLQRWTTKDPILSRVREYAMRGWPTTQHPNFQPYRQRQQELSVQDGCVLWGARVVIPERGRRPLLEQLHQSHPGMSRMKGLARSYMWWPHMENDIEDKVRSCSTCQEHRHRPQEAPLHPWEWPEKPWRRIHIDYAGPFLGKMFLVIVDAHSKWLDVYPVPSATAAATIDCLRNCFSTHGLPEMVVSDNAQCFVSAQTKEFMAKNGITHVTSAPYHPASNGLAERAVQTFKELMKKSTGDTLATKLNRALFSYRITPQSTTGKSPAELMMGRKLRCTLDLIHPDLKQKVTAKQDSQRRYHDRHAKERMFVIGDTVYTRNYGRGPKWIPGLIQEMTGPVSYLVMLGNGTVVRRHVDQLFARLEPCLAAGMPEGHPGEPPKAAPNISAETGDEDERHIEVQVTPVVKPHMESSDSLESPATGLRRSQRTKRKPEHLRDFVP